MSITIVVAPPMPAPIAAPAATYLGPRKYPIIPPTTVPAVSVKQSPYYIILYDPPGYTVFHFHFPPSYTELLN